MRQVMIQKTLIYFDCNFGYFLENNQEGRGYKILYPLLC